MKQIKVLQVIRQGEIGGGESHLMDLVAGFNPANVESVIMAFSDGPMMEHFRKQGIKCYVVHAKGKIDLSIQSQVKQILLNEQIELIHAHGTRAAINMIWSAHSQKIPLIYTVHGWSFHFDQTPWMHKLRVWCEQLVCKKSKKVICVSESNRVAAIEQKINLHDKCHVIENGINLNRFNPDASTNGIREELKIHPTDFIVGFIGRVTMQKSPIDFIKSIQLAHQVNPAIKGLFVGEGDLLNEVNKYIETEKLDKCIYRSSFRKDVPQVLQAIDVFCLPSLWEGLSIALLEAMAMKKTVVVTPTDGSREIIEQYKNGIVVPFNNPNQLADTYLELYQNPDLRIRCGESARTLVKQRFNSLRVSEEVTNLYKATVI